MKLLISIFFSIIAISAFAQLKSSYLFVGTYTPPRGNGDGISVYEFNPNDGSVKFISKVACENSSYLSISNNKKFVYAVNQNAAIKPNGVSAFSFNATNGTLRFVNSQLVNAEGPCYINTDKKNRWLFTANYTAGSLSVLPILKDGSIDTIRQLIQQKGSSIVKERQEASHMHTALFSPDEKFLITTNLGTDKISQFEFSSNSKYQPLLIDSTKDISVTPGSGPRHIAFGTSKKMMYVIQELSGNILAYSYIKNRATLVQKISTDTTLKTDKGSADIHVSNDGKFLYATNRGSYNNIAIYSIDEKGLLHFIALQSTYGKTPRNFTIDPSNQFLLVANQNSDNIVLFKRDIATGLLQQTGVEIKVGSPVCLKMIEKE